MGYGGVAATPSDNLIDPNPVGLDLRLKLLGLFCVKHELRGGNGHAFDACSGNGYFAGSGMGGIGFTNGRNGRRAYSFSVDPAGCRIDRDDLWLIACPSHTLVAPFGNNNLGAELSFRVLLEGESIGVDM